VVAAELRPVLADDRAFLRLEPVPVEEGSVVVAGEEARLLALRPPGGGEAGTLGLGPRRLLRLLPEREGDACKVPRVEGGEHVALVLGRIRAAGEQQPSVALDDPRVVAGREALGAGPAREREKLREAEAAVAARARVRRLAARVATHERRHHRAAELVAQ